ncbi:MAG: co-chaperone GroES [Candidatus Vogelbacteria bacterium]|nr:co-chaperone GroES [Candidatus Vogelbacteria bacterium]
MNKTHIKPLGDRVLVEPLAKEEKTKSGIIIPDTTSGERPEQGTVIAVGPGKMTDDGVLLPLSVKKGQKVIFAKYGPDEIKIDGKEYLIIKEENILGVIEE